MALIEHLRTQHRYETWASARVIAALRSAEALMGDAVGPGGGAAQHTVALYRRALGIAAHIQGARHEWLARLGRIERRPWTMFPDWPLDEIERDTLRLDALWTAYLDELTDAALARRVEYTSLEGKRYFNTVAAICSHVFNHGSYHRGQLAMLVRQAGGEPARTDHIAFTREEVTEL